MSVSGKRGVGIPVILLHDAEGGLITIELKNGCVYRGLLEEASDNMNCTIKDVRKTDTDGTESMIEVIYVRGGQIRFIVLPDMLRKAPFFNRIKMWRKFKGHAVFGGGGVIGPARGQAAAIMNKLDGGRGGGMGGRGGMPGRGGFMGGRGGGPGFGGPGAPYARPPPQQYGGQNMGGGGAYGGGNPNPYGGMR